MYSARAEAGYSGRVKTHDEIRRLLREYERSALPQRQFAAQAGVAYSTFTHWLRRARAGDFDPPQPEWIEAALPPAPSSATERDRFQIELAPDLRLHLPVGVEPEVIVQLLQQLRSSCSR